MAGMRLSGTTLRAVRWLAQNPLTRGPLWAATSKDFHIAELAALSSADRPPLDDAARPLAAAPPRRFGDGDLPAPEASPGTTVAGLAAAYRSRRASPPEVLERLLGRIRDGDFGDATFSPFVTVDEGRRARGAAASAARFDVGMPIGPLDGVPIAVKDQVQMTELPTRGGTRYRTALATADAWVIRRLREAGAIVFAKSHATEWGMNPLGFNDFYDFPRNPYRSDRAAGGSSTGSGVAVALGFGPAALGSDGGGSVRIPASKSGVFGIKPTFIRIGRTGDDWGSGTMGHLGPLGASTGDLVEFLAATAGVDPSDPTTTYQPDVPVEAWRAALTRGVRGARYGIVRGEWADCDPAMAQLGLEAATRLERAGAMLVDVDLPLARHASAMGALTIASEATANLTDDVARFGDQIGDELMVIYALLSQLSARDLLIAARTRVALRRQTAAVLAGVDALLLPVTAAQAAPYSLAESKKNLMDTASTAGITRFAFLGNLTGLPAGTAPIGMNDGMPVGLQILADAWDEATVFATMAALERTGVTQIPRPRAHSAMF